MINIKNVNCHLNHSRRDKKWFSCLLCLEFLDYVWHFSENFHVRLCRLVRSAWLINSNLNERYFATIFGNRNVEYFVAVLITHRRVIRLRRFSVDLMRRAFISAQRHPDARRARRQRPAAPRDKDDGSVRILR